MKVLHITPSYFPAIKFGGPIQSVHLLNKALVKKGVKVDVITTNAGLKQDQRKKLKEKSKEVLRQAQVEKEMSSRMEVRDLKDAKRFLIPSGIRNDKEQDDNDGWVDPSLLDKSNKSETCGVRVKYCDFVMYEHYNFSLHIAKEIWKVIDDYDLVHITAVWNFPVFAGAIISLIKKKPYIISPRGTIYQETIELKSTIVKKLYFNLFAKHYLNKASAIHFTSEDEKEKVVTYLNLKAPSFVVQNGLDLEEIELEDQGLEKSIKEIYILILGRIDKKKGFDILIPAFANVIKQYDNLNLVIAGDTDTSYSNTIIQLIQQFEISERVIFTGQVSGYDKWSLYKNALMFVLPSYSENFGMSVVEAMACGCPVVISDKVGIYKEVAENNAGVVVNTTVESVEEGILKLLKDEELRKTISANGKAMVEKYYDIDKVAAEMINQYRNICVNL